MDRREFLKLSAFLALSANLKAEEYDEYKAIVVLDFAGGNDSLNMFVPFSDDEKSGYSNYASIRDTLRVDDTVLTYSTDSNGALLLETGENNPYYVDGNLYKSYLKGVYKHDGMSVATNALMPELAYLTDQGNVAVVLNAGNLIMPGTKEEFAQNAKPLPPFLFAHDFQTKLMLNGVSATLNYDGWGSRCSKIIGDVNGSDIYTTNISFEGETEIFYGESRYLKLPADKVISYSRLNYRGLYDEGVNLQSDEAGSFYNALRKHSFIMQDALASDYSNAYNFTSTNAYNLNLFTSPSADVLGEKYVTTNLSLLPKLKSVAKWVKIFKDKGFKRNIFYITLGGFDTHSSQSSIHSSLLRGVSYALGDFYLALKEIGMENNVVLMQISEFGRSVGNNGDGTDHAWGGHLFVMGGDVIGGEYGTPPDLTLGGEDDITDKGRLIPTISYSQYYATILKWFGLSEEQCKTVLPELDNFENSDLGFMKV